MSELESAKKKAATTYNAAADFYDHPAKMVEANVVYATAIKASA